MHSAKNNSKVTDERWHQFRDMARKTAFSPEEFSDQERVRYNLDDDDNLSPAGITGEDTEETYVGDDEPQSENASQTDIRTEDIR